MTAASSGTVVMRTGKGRIEGGLCRTVCRGGDVEGEEDSTVSSSGGQDRRAGERAVRMLGLRMEVMIQGRSRSRPVWSC